MPKSAKLILSYIVGLLLTLAIFLGISETYTTIHNWMVPTGKVSSKGVFELICVLLTIIFLTSILAREIRANPDVVSVGATNIPNFMYHPDFKKESKNRSKILKEKHILKGKLEEQEMYTDNLLDELEQKDLELEQIAYISDIFIRHHKNASRLVRSLIQLLVERKPYWKLEFCNNVLDECVTILLEDRADKSSTIYFINKNNELEMFAYSRIEFSSSRNRKFKKGEGFAGHIWKTGKTELVSDVTISQHFREEYAPKHEYGSILGVPIKIGREIVGVLCVQSEGKNEFQEDDKRTVIFYADMCALAHFYDKIKNKEGV
ncbi:hypothetical protein BME96_15950 [Virgibacillus halodenitrificans]|uniref:GAF domain-containing protein n=1 Tax=Virgibacillus halodenitrificans TaxID=1482 RepID=A0AAC9J1V9_VIRHA|nr:GAF domain-containing protein [Virgibacillus halodenitrificans]APC49592.1 hypothetical protein BME96_15950 [Virgibacillus halodenitrificans]